MRAPCIHLGTRESRVANTIRGGEADLYSCALHGQCVLRRVDRTNRRRCTLCSDYKSAGVQPLGVLRAAKTAKACTPAKRTMVAEPSKSCEHRSALPIASAPCDVCGARNKAVAIYQCTLHNRPCAHNASYIRSLVPRDATMRALTPPVEFRECLTCADGPWADD